MPETLYLPISTPMELSMCMLGPRSVGKTTVMTSILFDTIKSLRDSKLSFDMVKPEDHTALQKYQIELSDAIKKSNAANLPASRIHSKFDFKLGTVRRPHLITLSVHDYPGEYLENNHRAEVFSFVENSTIIIVAIDTPYLMEDNGEYNDNKNKVELVSSYLKNIESLDGLKDKLVLFVPLKCERYAHDGRIEEVTDKVGEVYKNVIDYFGKNNIASVIAPIHTLGGIELDSLVDNTNSEFGKDAVYRPFIEEGKRKPKYAPLFCSQPLYYLLSYIANYYEWMNKQGRWWERWLRGLVALFRNEQEFYAEIKKMQSYMLTNTCGYRILTHNSFM